MKSAAHPALGRGARALDAAGPWRTGAAGSTCTKPSAAPPGVPWTSQRGRPVHSYVMRNASQ